MTEREVLDTGRHFLFIALQLALPVLLAALVTGVLVSIFQAATQIQEFTLTFVPKLLAVTLTLILLGSWMLATLVNFTVQMFQHMPPVTR